MRNWLVRCNKVLNGKPCKPWVINEDNCSISNEPQRVRLSCDSCDDVRPHWHLVCKRPGVFNKDPVAVFYSAELSKSCGQTKTVVYWSKNVSENESDILNCFFEKLIIVLRCFRLPAARNRTLATASVTALEWKVTVSQMTFLTRYRWWQTF